MSAIPADLLAVTRPLRRVARRRRVLHSATGLLQLLIVALTVVLAAALVAGWMDDPRKPVRWGLSVLAEMTLLAALISCLAPAFRRHRLKSIAREIESSLPGSHELLSSAVELSADRDARFAASPELVRHVVAQAATHARAIDPAAVVPLRNVPWWLLALMPVLFCWALLMTVMPVPTLRGLYTIAFPWRPTPANLLPVTVDPGHITRAAGEPLAITATVAPRVRSKPRVERATVETRYASGQTAAIDMTRTGPRAFAATVDKLTTDFQYRVRTEDGSSRWFVVTVMQRPVVTSVDVRYTYPAYTKLPPKDDPRKDGTVDALVGTEVSLTLHTSQPLITLPEKSRLVIAEKTDAQRVNLEPAPGSTDKDPAYLAKFFVTRSAPYRADIQNMNYLQATDEPERQITAREDEPPKVSFTSPQQKVTAALDDTVPVKFTASDDLGLSRLEMFVQVEGQQPELIEVPFDTGAASVAGTWPLKVAEVLARKKLKDANRIEYQLRVTDTRDPGPQSATTPRYVVEIDHANRPAAQRDAAATKELEKALKQAIEELKDERDWLKPMAEGANERAFNADHRKTVAGTKDSLLETAKELATAAEATAELRQDSPVATLAREAERVAKEQVEPAAERAASASSVNADQPAERHEDLKAAVAKADQARESLEKLLDQLRTDLPQQAKDREVADLARRQERVAADLAQANADPAKRQDQGQALREQQALRQRLEEMLNQDKDPGAQAARESAERNQQLVRRVEQLQEQQKRMDGLADKQQAVDELQAKVNEFARKQKELNQKIAGFAKADEAPIKAAPTKAPDAAKLDGVAKNLADPNQAPRANQQQHEIANELRQASQKLQESARRDDAAPGRRQQQARQDQKRAKDARDESAEAARQAIDAEERGDKARQAQAKQRQQQLAQRLEQQANEMKARAPDEGSKKSADEAKASAAEARQFAEQGDPTAAADQIADAADKLEAAGKAEEATAAEDRKAMAAAAKDAADLADAQQKLADETAKATQAQAQARAQQGDPAALERGQQQAQNEAVQAAAEAARVEQQDRQQKSDAMADRAAAAQKALKDAAQHEQSAAKAAHDHDAARARAEQKSASQALARAAESLRGSDRGMQPGDVASDLQEARQAQADAMGNKPDAAKQAALALARASASLQHATAAKANAQPSQVAKATPAPASPPTPRASADPTSGAGPDAGPPPDARPESVKQVGISAGDWAKLPPLTQQQLLNAAQQPGPPEYREQIKRYFVKIAKLQAEGK